MCSWGDPSGVVCGHLANRSLGQSAGPSNSLNISAIQLGVSLATGFLYLPHSILLPSTYFHLWGPWISQLSLLLSWGSGEPVVSTPAIGTSFFHTTLPLQALPFVCEVHEVQKEALLLYRGDLSTVVSVWPPGWLVLGME